MMCLISISFINQNIHVLSSNGMFSFVVFFNDHLLSCLFWPWFWFPLWMFDSSLCESHNFIFVEHSWLLKFQFFIVWFSSCSCFYKHFIELVGPNVGRNLCLTGFYEFIISDGTFSECVEWFYDIRAWF